MVHSLNHMTCHPFNHGSQNHTLSKQPETLQFLAEIKQTRKGTITQTERELLQQMAGLGLLDEVINIILLLTFNKVDSANINEKYAMKVANDYAYQKIHSAEEARRAIIWGEILQRKY